MFTCRICQKEFRFGWDHVLKGKFSEVIDDAHQEALDDIEDNGYLEPCPFCGGNISTFGNKDNYEIVCDDCGYLYEED